MPQAQAIIHTCTDFRVHGILPKVADTFLNLYAYEVSTDVGGVKNIFEGKPGRDMIFENIAHAVKFHGASRIILINHTDCTIYGGSEAFQNLEEEVKTHEIQIRHAISHIKAKFPEQNVEGYLLVLSKDRELKKVI